MPCNTCGKEYDPNCDWRQGRCPNHPAPFDAYKARYYNLIQTIKNFFKGSK